MWYNNIAGRFFGLVTKHACARQTDRRTDRQTDRITTPKTALAKLRCAVKTRNRVARKLSVQEVGGVSRETRKESMVGEICERGTGRF